MKIVVNKVGDWWPKSASGGELTGLGVSIPTSNVVPVAVVHPDLTVTLKDGTDLPTGVAPNIWKVDSEGSRKVNDSIEG
mgnify:CR=1 FL=1